jgi:hypothetical protein
MDIGNSSPLGLVTILFQLSRKCPRHTGSAHLIACKSRESVVHKKLYKAILAQLHLSRAPHEVGTSPSEAELHPPDIEFASK